MSLTKEVHRLMKTVRKRTDGQVSVEGFEPYEGDSRQVLTVAIEPNDGMYKGGRFIFLIQIPDSYPHSEQPSVWCESDVYHPNIDTTESRYDACATNVCLNMFDHGTWSNSFGLETIVHGLVFLMHNPNFDDPLCPLFEPGNVEFEKENIKMFMAGKEIDDRVFQLELAGEQRQELKLTDKDGKDHNDNEIDTKSNEETQDQTREGQLLEDESTTEDLDAYETCGGGFRVVAIDGELVLIADDRCETPEELVKTNTDEVSFGEIKDGTEDGHCLTSMAEDNIGEVKLNTATEPTESVDNNSEVTRNVHDNQSNTDKESSILDGVTKDNENNTKRLINTTEPDHDNAKKDKEELVNVAQLNDHINKLIESEQLQNKVSTVMIILANIHYIGGKLLRCLNERYT